MQTLKKVPKLKSAAGDTYVASMLDRIIDGKKVMNLGKGYTLFSQGAEASALYFIESGRVKLTMTSLEGKETVLAMLGPRDFFGEGCLVGQSLRISTATTTESSTVFEIQKRAMIQALHDQSGLSEKFVAALLVRNIDMEHDIGNQLFNHAERRLARVLLKLSRYGHAAFLPDAALSHLSDDALASLAGTTATNIADSLKKFRRLGMLRYHHNGNIVVRPEMLADLVLHI